MCADVNPETTDPADPADPAELADSADLADLILRVARRIQALEVRESGGVALTHLEAMVMSRIDDEPGVTPKTLGTELGLRSSNTSAALRSLEGKGLITRIPDAADGRVTRIHPTTLAAENLAQVRQVWRRALAPALGDGRDGDAASAADTADVAAAMRVLERISGELG
jgi:DNA-binding MarR family transcriptional regulator